MEFLQKYGSTEQETQCGFRGNRSTVDMIFCLRQLQEKCTEQDRPRYMVFVDFSKAFDTVGRTGLWQLLRKYGCTEKFTNMIEALHTGMLAKWRGSLGIAPTLFSIFLSAMLDEAFRDMVTYSTSHTSERRPRLLGY
ncbi:hypothetical protein NP493_163g03002 [Ridgeia piscesae]|uniref:Reverse transcriptase domain-containing protein n=1 Tax=Ridgeia piscesae TaxID=27915 RepID=A0AAD9P3K8_RIDPI|nr:hypothetical protein NP493_163g03002 [Ridgeia piscesae]